MIVATKGKVILKPIEPASISKGGILIPDVAKEKPVRGLVLNSGSDQIKDGETVIYLQYAGCPVEFDGEKLLIMTEGDILAVVEE